MFDIFFLPFMQRAIIAGIVVALLLGRLGIFTSIKNMSFLGDGVAHASLFGIALALFFGWMPTSTALVMSVVIAVGIYLLERHTRLSADASIGIMFTTGVALAIILLYRLPGFQPELMSYLFGNLLTIRTEDIIITLVIGAVIATLMKVYGDRLSLSLLDPEGAYLSGLNPHRYTLALYIILSVSIVLSIKLVGIILVSAFLITPSAISQTLAKNYRSYTNQSMFWAAIIVLTGLFASVAFNLPSGASIIVCGTTIFLVSLVVKRVMKKS